MVVHLVACGFLQRTSTVKPGSQNDAGNAKVTGVVSVAGKSTFH